ncbi:glycosyltransferase family 2 protein [Aureispira sp. CCB-QB1]|uniref:glycosyltransferase family 2 protein n=1 Tax=Aureispira sp. CCB-QB1 TaxID=1313421 RepID=UPI000695FB86|nr:glycosyltransferase family 2 protein [Aureispira sp. CCB-QB1]
MLIDILIPTYNRSEDLIYNLTLIQEELIQHQLLDKVKVIISDNCSPDNTQAATKEFLTQKNANFVVDYYRTEENIGLEKNAVHVLSKASSDFVMFLGDDDYLDKGYLNYCVEKINRVENLGCIITGIVQIDNNLKVIGHPRPTDFEEVVGDAGYESMLKYSHLGHQLSGLLLKRNNLLEEYLATKENRNIYLFIYFVTNRIEKYTVIYVPKFKTQVKILNAKDWDYNQLGLLDEVFKSYYPFITTQGEEKVKNLLIHFCRLHSYRFGIKKGQPNRLYQQYKKLLSIVPPLKNFAQELRTLLLKEYILLFIRK